jgi:hypothetical protein
MEHMNYSVIFMATGAITKARINNGEFTSKISEPQLLTRAMAAAEKAARK